MSKGKTRGRCRSCHRPGELGHSAYLTAADEPSEPVWCFECHRSAERHYRELAAQGRPPLPPAPAAAFDLTRYHELRAQAVPPLAFDKQQRTDFWPRVDP